jgi:hypothetical protein
MEKTNFELKNKFIFKIKIAKRSLKNWEKTPNGLLLGSEVEEFPLKF